MVMPRRSPQCPCLPEVRKLCQSRQFPCTSPRLPPQLILSVIATAVLQRRMLWLSSHPISCFRKSAKEDYRRQGYFWTQAGALREIFRAAWRTKSLVRDCQTVTCKKTKIYLPSGWSRTDTTFTTDWEVGADGCICSGDMHGHGVTMERHTMTIFYFALLSIRHPA